MAKILEALGSVVASRWEALPVFTSFSVWKKYVCIVSRNTLSSFFSLSCREKTGQAVFCHQMLLITVCSSHQNVYLPLSLKALCPKSEFGINKHHLSLSHQGVQLHLSFAEVLQCSPKSSLYARDVQGQWSLCDCQLFCSQHCTF